MDRGGAGRAQRGERGLRTDAARSTAVSLATSRPATSSGPSTPRSVVPRSSAGLPPAACCRRGSRPTRSPSRSGARSTRIRRSSPPTLRLRGGTGLRPRHPPGRGCDVRALEQVPRRPMERRRLGGHGGARPVRAPRLGIAWLGRRFAAPGGPQTYVCASRRAEQRRLTHATGGSGPCKQTHRSQGLPPGSRPWQV